MAWYEQINIGWGLVLILLAILGGFAGFVIKFKRAADSLGRVDMHEQQITNIGKDTIQLKKDVSDLSKDLSAHVIDQKKDISAIMNALFTMLDVLKSIDDSKTQDIDVARKDLRKHQNDK